MNEYPVQVSIDVPPKSSRILALLGILFYLKAIILLPSVIVLYFLAIAASIVAWIGYWVVLFTGRMPSGMHGFLTGVLRWQTRVSAWLYGLTDVYPPFSLR
jgi:hypothetical protein